MTIRPILPLLALLTAAAAPADDGRLQPGETAAHFAARLLNRDPADLNLVDASWNGSRAVFVDYLREERQNGEDVAFRELVALVQQPDGSFRRTAVSTAEEDGGTPEIAAIGFANADRDAPRELIVILRWPQQHYDYGGAFYEVRTFDTPGPGQPTLAALGNIDRHFGQGCECGFRDGRADEHYRFKTIAEVKRELQRLGY